MSSILATCRACGLQADVNRQQLSPFTSTRTRHISHAELERVCRHAERHGGSLNCVVLQRRSMELSHTITLSGVDKVDLHKKQWEWQGGTPGGVILTKVHADEVRPLVMASKFAKIEAPKGSISRRIEYYRRGG